MSRITWVGFCFIKMFSSCLRWHNNMILFPTTLEMFNTENFTFFSPNWVQFKVWTCICPQLLPVNTQRRHTVPGNEFLVVAPLVGRADGERRHKRTVRNHRLEKSRGDHNLLVYNSENVIILLCNYQNKYAFICKPKKANSSNIFKSKCCMFILCITGKGCFHMILVCDDAAPSAGWIQAS